MNTNKIETKTLEELVDLCDVKGRWIAITKLNFDWSAESRLLPEMDTRNLHNTEAYYTYLVSGKGKTLAEALSKLYSQLNKDKKDEDTKGNK